MHLLPTGGLSRWRWSSIHCRKSSGAGIMTAPGPRTGPMAWGRPAPRGAASAVLAVGADALERRAILPGQRRLAVDVEAQVVDAAVAQGVHPAVHVHRLAARPGVAHDRGLADVRDLLEHVELAQ